MQKERTLKFWDEFHETEGPKEWIVHPTPELFELIYSECSSSSSSSSSSSPSSGRDIRNKAGLLRVLEIGCGTSTMAREFCKYMDSVKKEDDDDGDNNCHLHIRSTDVSQVCVDACSTRDKDLPNVSADPLGETTSTTGGTCSALEYSTLNVLESPTENDRGAYDAILDKACLDTFLFRSRSRGENKTYPAVVQTALDNIWTMMADTGVYMILSPRTKIKAVRDYRGFSSVERRAIHSEEKGGRISSKNNKTKKESEEACYMYVCRKNLDYVVGGETESAFRENYRSLPADDAKCSHCSLLFGVFRNGEDTEGRGVLFWTREWKNHCIHCKAPHASKWVHDG